MALTGQCGPACSGSPAPPTMSGGPRAQCPAFQLRNHGVYCRELAMRVGNSVRCHHVRSRCCQHNISSARYRTWKIPISPCASDTSGAEVTQQELRNYSATGRQWEMVKVRTVSVVHRSRCVRSVPDFHHEARLEVTGQEFWVMGEHCGRRVGRCGIDGAVGRRDLHAKYAADVTSTATPTIRCFNS